MNIGIVEDNPAIATLLTTTLELAGHHVSSYREGTPLLEAIFKAPRLYDMVLVDLGLPGTMSGVEVIQAIRQTISPEVLPVVVVSAAAPQELAHVQKNHPDVSFVQKPFHMRSLLTVIEQRK